MHPLSWILIGFLSLVGCAHGRPQNASVTNEGVPENARLAKAQLMTKHGLPLQGLLNFEQMPNSTIVTYSLAGLRPAVKYQIFVNESPTCENLDLASATPLSQFRANRSGLAENTFKTEEFSVSERNPLLGKTILIVGQNAADSTQRLAPQIACGAIEVAANPPIQ